MNWYSLQRKKRLARKRRFSNKLHPIIAISLVLFIVSSIFAFSIYSQSVLGDYEQYFKDPKKMISYKIDTLTIFDRNGEVLYRTPGRYNTELIPLSEMSPNLLKATLTTEDGDFYKHEGFSFKAIARAFFSNVKEQNIYHQGGSTITQQLSRTFFLSNSKSFTRKIKELVLSIEMERKYSKDKILDFYLNSVYYGAGAYGAPEAAKIYFNKDVKDLSLAESALLAGLPSAPTTLSPIGGNLEKAKERQVYILDTLEKKGYYSKEEIEKAKSEKLVINDTLPSYAEAPHFALMIKRQLEEQFPNVDIDKSGFRIYTTIDKKLQEKAEELVKERVGALKNRNVTNGAFLATNPQTGEIVAMVGSVNFNQPQWGTVNILTSPRSPGSAIKPLIYASAFESKTINTSTILLDEETTYKNDWETYTPTDSDLKTRGKVLPRIALANSLNIPAVEVIAKNGVPQTIEDVKHLGIKNLGQPNDYGLSFALGGLELRGLDLAASYGSFANGGYLIRPWGIKKVEDRFGKTLWENKVEKTKVLNPQTAYIINDILSDEKARELLLGANNPLEIGRTAAAKTGTGQDFKNAWTVGYTPSLLGLAWVGNNDNSSMRDIWGLESAAVIWNRFMKSALAGTKVEEFPIPVGITKERICSLDGSKAVSGQPSVEEVFVIGSEPTEYGICGFRKSQEEEKVRLEQEKARLEEEQKHLLEEKKQEEKQRREEEKAAQEALNGQDPNQGVGDQNTEGGSSNGKEETKL